MALQIKFKTINRKKMKINQFFLGAFIASAVLLTSCSQDNDLVSNTNELKVTNSNDSLYKAPFIGTWISTTLPSGSRQALKFTEDNYFGSSEEIVKGTRLCKINNLPYHYNQIASFGDKNIVFDGGYTMVKPLISKDGLSFYIFGNSGVVQYRKFEEGYSRGLTKELMIGTWVSEAKYEEGSREIWKFTEDNKMGRSAIAGNINLDRIEELPYHYNDISSYENGLAVVSKYATIDLAFSEDGKSFIKDEGPFIIKFTKYETAETTQDEKMKKAMVGMWITNPTGEPGAVRNILQFTEDNKMRQSTIAEFTSVVDSELVFTGNSNVLFASDKVVVDGYGTIVPEFINIGTLVGKACKMTVGQKTTYYTKIR